MADIDAFVRAEAASLVAEVLAVDGSQPAVYAEWLGAGPDAPTVRDGYMLPSDRIHAPDERLPLANSNWGVRAWRG